MYQRVEVARVDAGERPIEKLELEEAELAFVQGRRSMTQGPMGLHSVGGQSLL